MPREVNADQRLAAIADATVRVARTSGAQAVTIRSVARELGGSTTLVTNYLPTRAALIANALDRAQDRWRVEREEVGATADGADQLTTLLEATLTSNADDPVLRTLILEIVANASVEPELGANLRRESAVFQDELVDAASASGYENPRRVAELLYLLLRGATIATVEDPAHWNDAHLREVILETIAVLHQPTSRR